MNIEKRKEKELEKKEKRRKELTMLETKNLIKNFGGKTALNDVSFLIEPGKTYLLLGPNGLICPPSLSFIPG